MTRTTTLLIAALLVSVLINGVLGGVLIQRAAHGPVERAGTEETLRGPAGRFRPAVFLQALPADVRGAARAQLREGARELRPMARAAVRARRDALATLQAEPFNAEAAAEAMSQARAARAALEAHTERVVLEIVGPLTAQERREALRAAWGAGARRGPLRERRGERFGRDEG